VGGRHERIKNLFVAAGVVLLALASPALAQSGRTIKLRQSVSGGRNRRYLGPYPG